MTPCPRCQAEMYVYEYDMAFYPVYRCRPCNIYIDPSQYLYDDICEANEIIDDEDAVYAPPADSRESEG